MTPPLLSILVPTMTGRETAFSYMMRTLTAQIAETGTEMDVEIVSEMDDGSLTIGEKRNIITARATGTFVVSIDDDDDIHPQYLSLVISALRRNPNADVLGLRGEMLFENGTRQTFVYSNTYTTYRTIDGVMTRPPHHLNPMRRSIALEFPFEHVRAHEDADVSRRMARAGVLKQEVMIEPVLYVYQTRRNVTWHKVLEKTEFFRHLIGFKLVNLVPLRRGLRLLLWQNGRP